MTLLSRANRDFLKKHAPKVDDVFTIEVAYDIKGLIIGAHEGEPVLDERWKARSKPEPIKHLDVLARSGHILLLEEVSTATYAEKVLKRGGIPIHIQTSYSRRKTFRRRK